MDPWGGSRKAHTKVLVVKNALGPVRRNKCQIRRVKAEPADGYSTLMDQLARTGETTTKR